MRSGPGNLRHQLRRSRLRLRRQPCQAAAWRTIPSWGLVAGRDKAIPPKTQRWMCSRANFRRVVEVPTSSHVAMLSHPKAVADLIKDAAKATG
ncbi:alpha/beta fold hydrolase [Kribbella sp. NPDC056345]|uniref:alpha/beta fold hydrolase n=1 Tax=Kribbella sp. NPDC056345 TaxID=3345789 RepID=UPI0035DF9092